MVQSAVEIRETTHLVQTDVRAWNRRVSGLLTVLLVVRMLYLAVVPLELCPDEAYYWDWSRQLDWGYYSKPPMIAWLIAAATSLGGSSEFVIRMPAVLLGTIGLFPVYWLGRRMFGPEVGFWSVLAVAATPGMAAMNMLMTIDAPFLCAWAFACCFVWRWISEAELRWNAMFPAMIATGLGLLSKQTMVAIMPLTLLWLVLIPEERRKLRSPQLAAWIVGSLMFTLPVVWWNHQHGWITAQHTSEHFQAKAASLSRHLALFLEFWASQFGVISPITCGLVVAVTVLGLLAGRKQDRRVLFLLCLSAVPMLGVSMLSALQRVQPNWPAAFHLTALVLMTAWAREVVEIAGLRAALRRWFPVGIAVGGLLVLGVYSVPFLVPGSSLAGGKLDATARLRGWRQMGQLVGQEIAREAVSHDVLLIAATGRGPVSALAFYLPHQPRVYRWNPTGIVESQHEVWGGPVGGIGRNAVLITHVGQDLPVELRDAFSQVRTGAVTDVYLGGTRHERLQLWYGSDYRGWPVLQSKDSGSEAEIAGSRVTSRN